MNLEHFLQLKNRLLPLQEELKSLSSILLESEKRERLLAIEEALLDPKLWSNQEGTKNLSQEKTEITKILNPILKAREEQEELFTLLALLEEQMDEALLLEFESTLISHENTLGSISFQKMFSGEADGLNAFLEVQSGSGGTEAQDWAEMLFRMYSRFCEQMGFEYETTEHSNGDVAGIRSATLHIKGAWAYGYLRTETGIHRLVRKSPFDSGNRRHTSFASVFVSPELNERIDIEINPSDLRIDTYRSSGAGGQHVNKTDSAVRITHKPTGLVAQCQTERSQHQNKERAMNQLRSKLYEVELAKKRANEQELEDSKSDISWGHQIRSYVLDQSRIKDLRTNHETGNTKAVLDGSLKAFIEASLKMGL